MVVSTETILGGEWYGPVDDWIDPPELHSQHSQPVPHTTPQVLHVAPGTCPHSTVATLAVIPQFWYYCSYQLIPVTLDHRLFLSWKSIRRYIHHPFISNMTVLELSLTRRCCCFSLRTGSIIIASIYLVLGVLTTVAAVGFVAIGYQDSWALLLVSLAMVGFNIGLIVGIVRSSYVAVMFWVLASLVALEANLIFVVRDLVQMTLPLYVVVIRLTIALLQVFTTAVVRSFSVTTYTHLKLHYPDSCESHFLVCALGITHLFNFTLIQEATPTLKTLNTYTLIALIISHDVDLE